MELDDLGTIGGGGQTPASKSMAERMEAINYRRDSREIEEGEVSCVARSGPAVESEYLALPSCMLS